MEKGGKGVRRNGKEETVCAVGSDRLSKREREGRDCWLSSLISNGDLGPSLFPIINVGYIYKEVKSMHDCASLPTKSEGRNGDVRETHSEKS